VHIKTGRKYSLAAVIFASLFSSFLAFIKFNPCRSNDFAGSIATSKACYSDIPIFWIGRVLEAHLWPFSFFIVPEYSISINPIEYPVIIGLVIWLVSYITPTNGLVDVNYFDVNAIILTILFVISSFFVLKMNRSNVYLYIFAPAVFFSLFINWDMWAVVPALMCVYYFDQKKLILSSIFLAIAISAKFYPIVLLLPIFFIFVKRKKWAGLIQYLFTTLLIYLLINIPFVVNDFDGWFYFFEANFSRGIGYGSLWEALQIFGVPVDNLNLLYVTCSLVTFSIIGYYYYKLGFIEKLSQIAFLSIFAFTLFSKVYSPQYVLWLAPFAVLAIGSNRSRIAYFGWQLMELVYHFAIWRYLYWLGDGKQVDGTSPELYATISLLRLVALIIFSVVIMNEIKIKNLKPADTRGFEAPKPFRG
jgi:hypothetical protein